MTRVVCPLLLVVALTGCASLAAAQENPWLRTPLLIVEGQRWNAPIRNPHPPAYGIDAPGGCIVESEFHVAIERMTYDVRARKLHIEGRLIHGVKLALLTWNAGEEPGRVLATSNAPFVVDIDPAHHRTLAFSTLGYRTLLVDLRMLSRRAARVQNAARS